MFGFLFKKKEKCMDEDLKIHPHCVPEAIYNALGWRSKTGQEVRIIVQKLRKTETEDVDHVQAEAFDPGRKKWIPLTIGHDSKLGAVVKPWTRHFPNTPYRYIDVETFVNEQLPKLIGETTRKPTPLAGDIRPAN